MTDVVTVNSAPPSGTPGSVIASFKNGTCDHAVLDASENILSVSQVMRGIHPLAALLACSFGVSGRLCKNTDAACHHNMSGITPTTTVRYS